MADLTGMMQAAAGVGGGENLYIEDVFSTYLYDGTGSAQTITNGIDLDGEGGLVWIKPRPNTNNHRLHDTERGAGFVLSSNLTQASESLGNGVTSFNSDGFTLGTNSTYNGSGVTFASWTFRKAPKFFDIVTYTGVDAARTINHNLGVVPGCIIIKRTDITSDWSVYHRSSDAAPEDYFLKLQTTEAKEFTFLWNGTAPTDTQFSLAQSSAVNEDGGTFVAYLFAHDAGGFGDDGEQNVVTCGSYVGSGGSDQDVSLGFEPQMMIVKCSSEAKSDGWIMVDTMRGMDNSANSWLFANTSAAENEESPRIIPTATGFRLRSGAVSVNDSGKTFIYIAIRRGPMKTPESGTEVYNAITRTGTSSAATVTGVGFPPDITLIKSRSNARTNITVDRLRGSSRLLYTSSNDGEGAFATYDVILDQMDGVRLGTASDINGSSPETYINHYFRRAPSFMDIVAYTGNYSTQPPIPHNLGVIPELIVSKKRSVAGNWYVYHSALGVSLEVYLNGTNAQSSVSGGTWAVSSTTWNHPGSQYNTGDTNVAYLFATLAGISKVGTYTGTGTTLQINCGFSAGARFVLIKRADETGAWYVWDTARGIIAGNDPYLLLNSTAAEVTNTDYIDPLASGFEISSTAPAAINASGGTFIFLAIA